MISTRRGLVVLAVITVALLALVLLAGPHRSGAVDRTLVPGFDAAKITRLVIERPGDRYPPIELLRPPGDQKWIWHAPDGIADVRTIEHHDDLPVDASTVDSLLTALRGA